MRSECFESVWKLISAMKYHFSLTENEVGADMVKVTRSKLSTMTDSNFLTFCQMIMDHYTPATYTPHGVNEAEMNAVKLKLNAFPSAIQAVSDARVKRKKAVADFKIMLKEMDTFIKFRITTLMNVVGENFEEASIRYSLCLPLEMPAPTTGKPHKKGSPEPEEIIVLDKAAYRSKLGIIVTNTGTAPLQVGRSTNQTEIQGTPFIIEPGKTRRRISQKLGSKGEYILIQNTGDVKGKFEVWMKE